MSQTPGETILDKTIDENTSFDRMIGAVQGKLILNCGQVMRLNSAGVRSWKRYFDSLAANGVELIFTKCSPAMIEQITLFTGFLCGGRVESFYLPYLCSKCGDSSNILITPKELEDRGFTAEPISCPACGGQALFDDDQELYFSFLKP